MGFESRLLSICFSGEISLMRRAKFLDEVSIFDSPDQPKKLMYFILSEECIIPCLKIHADVLY